ncbi:MAG: PD-(D/E)XK nuclease family protein, partial [Saprospiraceae bacterium]|nr:PD-(D/E)XK nuclease family protein [Saprospiraceae bacterium]
GLPVRGKADLVLRRGESEWAIVDLKWSGARRRREMIRNGEDLQLILYAKLLPPPENWAHTAYFILEDGKMIARNKAAFSNAIDAGGVENHSDMCDRIFERMERTFAWRMDQVEKGVVELRTARTASELEALYAEELLDLLEMKTEDARWDDYRTLLGI